MLVSERQASERTNEWLDESMIQFDAYFPSHPAIAQTLLSSRMETDAFPEYLVRCFLKRSLSGVVSSCKNADFVRVNNHP